MEIVIREASPDIPYCASSFLMYRTIIDRDKCFSKALPTRYYERDAGFEYVHNSIQLAEALKRQVEIACSDGKAALALSGGIDSAILARYMPKGSKAYTFKCVVPGIEVVDESTQAAKYAKECGLEHEVVEITWEDMQELAPQLMRRKGAPIHSIEVQIAKASLKAREDGFEKLIFGESADVNYGGQSGLFSGTWTFGQWVDRYSYILPYTVLKEWCMPLDPCSRHCGEDGYIDVLEFCRDAYFLESMGSYENAASWGGSNLLLHMRIHGLLNLWTMNEFVLVKTNILFAKFLPGNIPIGRFPQNFLCHVQRKNGLRIGRDLHDRSSGQIARQTCRATRSGFCGHSNNFWILWMKLKSVFAKS